MFLIITKLLLPWLKLSPRYISVSIGCTIRTAGTRSPNTEVEVLRRLNAVITEWGHDVTRSEVEVTQCLSTRTHVCSLIPSCFSSVMLRASIVCDLWAIGDVSYRLCELYAMWAEAVWAIGYVSYGLCELWSVWAIDCIMAIWTYRLYEL